MGLMLPTRSGATMDPRGARIAFASDPASMGSPRPVPVPWASMHTISLALTEASPKAARSKPCWATPLGAVSEADL
eukprot:scaffold161274_cov50-Tisochrysis_lutea.AAC.2